MGSRGRLLSSAEVGELVGLSAMDIRTRLSDARKRRRAGDFRDYDIPEPDTRVLGPRGGSYWYESTIAPWVPVARPGKGLRGYPRAEVRDRARRTALGKKAAPPRQPLIRRDQRDGSAGDVTATNAGRPAPDAGPRTLTPDA